ncbi:MAG: DUF4307 domain-containing protein [Gordonia sp. (in: high G+C Gram-positive bacteria)]|uniref:DUF4307 domain-containing protein n=1 Tax=Gordonia sp. (in: high G+C Gram-positive bacteria) TaxID=84139 RepID=UPI0039E4820A
MSSSDRATNPTPPQSGPRATYPTEQSPQSRRRWFIAASIGVVIAGLIVAFLGFRSFGDPDISGSATGYDVISPDTIAVQYTVNRKDPSHAVACVVRGRAQDGSEVGRREVLIPASRDVQVGARTEVRTSREAVIGEVFGCTGNVPAYLKPID